MHREEACTPKYEELKHPQTLPENTDPPHQCNPEWSCTSNKIAAATVLVVSTGATESHACQTKHWLKLSTLARPDSMICMRLPTTGGPGKKWN